MAQPQPQMMPANDMPQASPEMQFTLNYADEIKTMFMSADFKESQQQQRREMVGSAIYKYVEQMLGPEVSPKITGMIINMIAMGLAVPIHNPAAIMNTRALRTPTAAAICRSR